MDIYFNKLNRTLVVQIRGEIDHHSSEEIKNRIEKEFIKINGKNIIFNFEKVTFMDSSGIGMVIGRYKYVKTLDGTVAVACMNETIDRIFSISGLYKIMKHYETLESALDSLEGGN